MTISLRPVDQQVIVVTGASSGIGLVTARTAAGRGAAVSAAVAVARFFGMTNLLPATLAYGLAQTPLGPLRLADTEATHSGMMVGIRPEHVCRCKVENLVAGRVIARTNLGSHRQVSLACVGDTALTALLPVELPVALGSELTVSLPPDRHRVVAER